MLQVGFIGLGTMGAPMARTLARAGFPLAITTRTFEKAQALAGELSAGGAVLACVSVAPPPLLASGVPATSFSPRGLVAGSAYVWNVVAHAACDPARTTASATRSFRLTGGCAAPGAFTVTSPQDGSSGVPVTTALTWPPSANALPRRDLPRPRPVTNLLRRRAHRGDAARHLSRRGELRSSRPHHAQLRPHHRRLRTVVRDRMARRRGTRRRRLGRAGAILPGRLELSPSVPFFYLVDPLGGDTAFVTLAPREPKSFDVRFSGPPSNAEGTYQGLIVASSTGAGLSITPYAFVNLKVGASDTSAPEIRSCSTRRATARCRWPRPS